jgi:aminomethyltransferase
MSALQKTPLFDLMVEQKARMTPFAGWEMPIQFSGLKQEHQAVRTSVGMFDISHMGKFSLSGKNLIEQLQKLVPSDLSRLEEGQAQYTVLLNPQAGIIDDIIVYYQGSDRAIAIVNAATTSKDKTWLLEHLEGINFEDISSDKVLIALQGPQALATLQPLIDKKLVELKPFSHITVNLMGKLAFIARTGYTGEDGFEIALDRDLGIKLWQYFLDLGVVPCGLGARDTLRLEAAMALYGQDIDDNTTPLEAGLGWLVHLDSKGDFIGRSVLEAQKSQGVERRLVGFTMEGRHIARHGYPLLAGGKIVGEVTSGTFAPTLEKAIALAYVPSNFSKIGQHLEVEIRGKLYPAVVVKKPFYRSLNKV